MNRASDYRFIFWCEPGVRLSVHSDYRFILLVHLGKREYKFESADLEDNAIKHYEICRILKRNGIEEIDWVRNLEDGLKKVEENKYNLYITDMWYPKHSGGPDNRSGELFIEEILKRKDPAPVILCSNQNYAYPEIYGTLYYSERSDWEEELERYIRQLKQ